MRSHRFLRLDDDESDAKLHVHTPRLMHVDRLRIFNHKFDAGCDNKFVTADNSKSENISCIESDFHSLDAT